MLALLRKVDILRIFIFGIGTFAELALHYFRRNAELDIHGFTLDNRYIKQDHFNGLPVVPFEEIDRHFPPDAYSIFLAIGYNDANRSRATKYLAAESLGYSFVDYVDPHSLVSDECHVGEGCFLFESSVLQAFCSLGKSTFIWPGSIVSHHSQVGNFCYVSPNTTISGNARIGNRVFLGAGSIVRDGIAVCDDVVLGMGSVVTRDIDRPGVYAGTPARFVREYVRGSSI